MLNLLTSEVIELFMYVCFVTKMSDMLTKAQTTQKSIRHNFIILCSSGAFMFFFFFFFFFFRINSINHFITRIQNGSLTYQCCCCARVCVFQFLLIGGFLKAATLFLS